MKLLTVLKNNVNLNLLPCLQYTMDFGYDDTLHDTLADLPTCAPVIFFDTDTTGATGTETNYAL